MQFTVECMSCGKKLKATEQHIGKKAKCSNCGKVVVIQAPGRPVEPSTSPPGADGSDDVLSSLVELSPPPRTTQPVFSAIPTGPPPFHVVSIPSPTAPRERSRRSAFSTAGVAILFLIIGYFAGREHLKYQLASALQSVGEAFSKGMSKGFGDPDTEKPAPPNQAQAQAPVRSPVAPSAAKSKAIPEVGVEDPYRTDEFEIILTTAAVDKVPLKDTILGEKGVSQEPALMLGFIVRNVHDRKILRFSGDNTFSQKFRLFDDVDNAIRGVSFGFSQQVIGAIQPSDDIGPGEQREHMEVFLVPPPKTQFLILKMDCSAFGGEGTVHFKVPVRRITGM